jgi:hypothetical protein
MEVPVPVLVRFGAIWVMPLYSPVLTHSTSFYYVIKGRTDWSNSNHFNFPEDFSDDLLSLVSSQAFSAACSSSFVPGLPQLMLFTAFSTPEAMTLLAVLVIRDLIVLFLSLSESRI